MGLELIVMRDTSLEPNSFAITAEISSLGNPQRLLSLCEVAGIFRKSKRALQQQIYDGGIVRGEVPPPIRTDSRNLAWVPLVVDIFLREKARAALVEYGLPVPCELGAAADRPAAKPDRKSIGRPRLPREEHGKKTAPKSQQK